MTTRELESNPANLYEHRGDRPETQKTVTNMTEQATTKYGTGSLASWATHQQRDRSPHHPGNKFSALVLVATFCVVTFLIFHSKNALRAKDRSPFILFSLPSSYAHQRENSFHLLLLRHAKSSWEDPDLSDEQRPLNSKGINDAQRLGAFLRKHKVHFPDMIIASPSVRTRQTLQLVQGNNNNNNNKNWAAEVSVEYDELLYTLAMTSYVDFCRRRLDPNYKRVLLVGHNPAMQNTARQLLRNETLKFPPGSFLEIELENATDWDSINNGSCKVTLFVTPYMI